MASKALTDADQAAWTAYVSRVTPLTGRARPEPRSAPVRPSHATPSQVAAPSQNAPGAPRRAAARLAIGTHPPGLDAATWQRFHSGRMPAARRLDLHGHTAQRAFQALCHFVKIAHAEHVRCVEVITGQGGPGGGLIRRELPHWLNLPDLRPLILAVAYPTPLNQGAVRLLLRRVRA
ncbi:MAG TPA: Smr/MutS family protein [Acetobacteraceae bacterium]|nr:Smr/MutS family protein [Acetobacteraceae bacterium]